MIQATHEVPNVSLNQFVRICWYSNEVLVVKAVTLPSIARDSARGSGTERTDFCNCSGVDASCCFESSSIEMTGNFIKWVAVIRVD